MFLAFALDIAKPKHTDTLFPLIWNKHKKTHIEALKLLGRIHCGVVAHHKVKNEPALNPSWVYSVEPSNRVTFLSFRCFFFEISATFKFISLQLTFILFISFSLVYFINFLHYLFKVIFDKRFISLVSSKKQKTYIEIVFHLVRLVLWKHECSYEKLFLK